MFYLAIDQHSKQLTVNVRNEAGDVVERKQVSTKGSQPREFLEKLAGQSGAEGYAAIVEVCGFNDWLLELLPQCGCRRVLLVQPRERSSRKTDRRDANQLGEILWVNRQRLLNDKKVQGLRVISLQSPQERDDRRLAAQRRRVGRELTRTINAVHTILRRHNLQHDCPTKGLQTKKARAWLKTLSLGPIERRELDHLLARWELLEQQRGELETAIQERVSESAEAKLLRTIPGCGPYMALGLAAHVGQVERFPAARSLANYWGLTPLSDSSGDTRRLGSITKEGSPLARQLLAQLVLHVLRKDGKQRAWYGALKRRRGARIARVAVMRRLAETVWHLLTHQEAYCRGGSPRRSRPPAA